MVDARQIAQPRHRRVCTFRLRARGLHACPGDPTQPTLDVHLQEKSWGPHIVRFDLGLHIGTDANTAFTIGGDYLQTWINDRGGELPGFAAAGSNLRPRGLLLPATRRGASLVRRAGPDRATIHRGPLRRRRRGDALSTSRPDGATSTRGASSASAPSCVRASVPAPRRPPGKSARRTCRRFRARATADWRCATHSTRATATCSGSVARSPA